jgi:hypothetical protein
MFRNGVGNITRTATEFNGSCLGCSHRWNAKNEVFERMRSNPHAITVVLDLYFKGVSLRKIVDHLKQFERVNVSHAAIIKWIKKYVALMRDYVTLYILNYQEFSTLTKPR